MRFIALLTLLTITTSAHALEKTVTGGRTMELNSDAKFNEIQAQLASLTSALEDANSTIDDLQSQINDNKDLATTANNNAKTANTNATTANQTANSAKSSIGTVKNKVNETINARNGLYIKGASLCKRGGTHSIYATCPSGYQVVACHGGSGDLFESSESEQITMDRGRRACRLYVRNPACYDGNSNQRVYSVCEKVVRNF